MATTIKTPAGTTGYPTSAPSGRGSVLPPGQGGIPPGQSTRPRTSTPQATQQPQTGQTTGQSPQTPTNGNTGIVGQTPKSAAAESSFEGRPSGANAGQPPAQQAPAGGQQTPAAEQQAAGGQQGPAAGQQAPAGEQQAPAGQQAGGAPPANPQAGAPPGQGGVPPGQAKKDGYTPQSANPGTQTPAGGQPPVTESVQTPVQATTGNAQTYGQPPGQGGTPPGQGGVPPGQANYGAEATQMPAGNYSYGQAPGQGGGPPGQGGVPPGQANYGNQNGAYQNGNGAYQTGGYQQPGGYQPQGGAYQPSGQAGYNPQTNGNQGYQGNQNGGSTDTQSYTPTTSGTPLGGNEFSTPSGSGMRIPPGQGGIPPGQAKQMDQTGTGPTVQPQVTQGGLPAGQTNLPPQANLPPGQTNLPPGQGGLPPGQAGLPPGQAQSAQAQTAQQPNLGTPLTEIPLANAPVKDGFNTQLKANPNVDAAVRGTPVEAPVNTLVPPLHDTQTLSDVQNRFENDYPVLKHQVADLPHLSDPEKANRAFDFFAQYANRFVALATRDNAKPQDQKQDTQTTQHADTAVEVPLDPELAHELATSKPVTDLSEADEELGRGQSKQSPDEAKAKNGKDGRLARLLEGEGDAQPKEPKKNTGEGRLGRLLGGDIESQLLDEKAKKAAQDGAGKKNGEGKLDDSKLRSFAGELARQLEEAQRQQQGQGKGMSQAEVQKQAKAFAEMLRSMDFDKMKELFSGKDGVQFAYELLTAPSMEAFQKMLRNKEMTAEHFAQPQKQDGEVILPPEDYHPATMAQEPPQVKDLGESRPRDARQEADRLLNQQDKGRLQQWQSDGGKVIITPAEREKRELKAPSGEGIVVFGEMGRRLGSNHLWNVLHQMRGEGWESAVEKEKFDQMAFGAILLLTLLMLVVIALVAL